MNDVFLETLIELVSSNEKTIQEIKELLKGLPDHSPTLGLLDTRIDGIEKAVQDIPSRVSMPIAEIVLLQHQLEVHRRQLDIPLKKEVRHEHHISKSVLGYVVLSLVILGLILLEYHTWTAASQHNENDIKYRYLQVFQDSQGKDYLHRLDSQYNSDPGQFRKEVIRQEEHNREQQEKWQRLQEKKEDLKEYEKEILEPPNGPRKKGKPDRAGK